MTLSELVTDPSLVIAGLEAASPEDALRAVAARLVDAGRVHPSFPDAVVAREAEFPTGLPTEPIGVAIPHSDPEHVISTTVALATLRSPVRFQQMAGEPTDTVDVSIIVMLAVAEAKAQVQYLSRVIGAIQDADLAAALLEATSDQQLLDVLARTEAG